MVDPRIELKQINVLIKNKHYADARYEGMIQKIEKGEKVSQEEIWINMALCNTADSGLLKELHETKKLSLWPKQENFNN